MGHRVLLPASGQMILKKINFVGSGIKWIRETSQRNIFLGGGGEDVNTKIETVKFQFKFFPGL